MAAIQNDRDILLQAASVRIIPIYVEAAGISITANTTTITGPTSGASTPASINLTAKLLGGLTGTVTWSKTGTGTLVPSGNTATITGSTMDFNPVVVTASIVVGSKTYSSQINLIKIKDQSEIQGEVNNLMNGSKDFVIRTDAVTVAGAAGTTTVPASVKLEAIKKNGLSGTVSWSIFAGVGSLTTYSGDTTYLTGSSITGNSVTVKASITASGKTYDAYVAINRLGAIASKDTVDLTNQVTGQLASGNVSGLGAMALLNTVNLNTQTTGALNGATQVTNLGTLAYANAIAANQIGAGTLAAGVVYAGTVNASQVSAGSFSGKTFTGGMFTGAEFQTTNNGGYVFAAGSKMSLYDSGGTQQGYLSAGGSLLQAGQHASALTVQGGGQGALTVIGMGSSPAVWLTGSLKWGNTIWPSPSGSANDYLRADGQWRSPADDNYLRGVNVSGSAGALVGYIVLQNGYKIPYYNP